jgi:hypothetical protein
MAVALDDIHELRQGVTAAIDEERFGATEGDTVPTEIAGREVHNGPAVVCSYRPARAHVEAQTAAGALVRQEPELILL